MNSHEYANKLKEFADFLLSKPAFDADYGPTLSFWYWSKKDKFLDAVRALGSGRKEYDPSSGVAGDSLDFYPDGVPEGMKFYVRVSRSAVCRKVQEEKWECEPLLSQEEEAQVGA